MLSRPPIIKTPSIESDPESPLIGSGGETFRFSGLDSLAPLIKVLSRSEDPIDMLLRPKA
jgi:hypothetical protein